MLIEEDDFKQLEQLSLRLLLEVPDERVLASLLVEHIFECDIINEDAIKERLDLFYGPLSRCQPSMLVLLQSLHIPDAFLLLCQ